MIHISKVKETIQYLFTETWKYRRLFFLLYLLDILLKAIQPFINVVFPKVIIEQFIGEKNLEKIIFFTALMVLLNVVINILLVFASEHLGKTYNDALQRLFEAKLAFKNMVIGYEYTENKQNLDESQKAKTGISLDYSGGVQGVTGSFSGLISNAITLMGTIGLVISKSPLLLVVIVVNVLINSIVNKKKNNLQVYQFKRLSQLSRAFNYIYFTLTDIRYAQDIRLYNADVLMSKKADTYNQEQSDIMKQQQRTIFGYLRISSINMAIASGVSYFYLGYLALNGYISIGDFTMLAATSTTFLGALNGIISESLDLQKKCTYAYEYVHYMNKSNNFNNEGNVKIASADKFVIEYKNVYFSYPGTYDYALKNVSIRIESGEHLSIVGLNGAGKTTFIKLLCRFYQVTSGEILLNGINIWEYDYREYMQMISAVFQDFKLLALSIKENITLEKSGHFDDDKLLPLISKVGLGEKIRNLKAGINTPVFKHFDVSGFIPSGGEQQKIAIARALFKNSPIVILDEPTAALDPIAEFEIYKQFNDLVRGKTAIYISHRLSSCKFCDKVAVFSDGHIVEYGTHDDLIEREDGIYFKLFNTQAQYYY